MKKLIYGALLIAASFTQSFAQKKELFKTVWPEEYQWKIVDQEDNKTMRLVEMVPGAEKKEKWTFRNTTIEMKGIKKVPMKDALKWMLRQVKDDAPKAKITMIDKDDKAKHPWALYKIEIPEFVNDKSPESQLYYTVQGKHALYTSCIAVHVEEMPESFIEKWGKVLKASTISYE